MQRFVLIFMIAATLGVASPAAAETIDRHAAAEVLAEAFIETFKSTAGIAVQMVMEDWRQGGHLAGASDKTMSIVSEETKALYLEIMEELSREILIPQVMMYSSDNEIDDVVSFYKSSVGKKMLLVMRPLSLDVVSLGFLIYESSAPTSRCENPSILNSHCVAAERLIQISIQTDAINLDALRIPPNRMQDFLNGAAFIYAKYFSEKEINAIAAFRVSSGGKKMSAMVRVLPQEFGLEASQRMKRRQPKLNSRIRARLEAEGLEIPPGFLR
ncbi:MAG: DUF2059 domain-containing protein [Rhodospirillales bacterium]